MIVAGDFETFYSKEYSLTRMSEAEYILDSRFQVIMLSLKFGERPSEVYVGHDAIRQRLAEIDWSTTAWLSHNTRFDGAILAWHYGRVPKLYLDTLSMARATTHWHIGKSSLKALSDALGLPPKGDEVIKAVGKRLEDFTPAELDAYASYCMRDNDNCYDIWKIMREYIPAGELALIDVIMRMFIQPQITLNGPILEANRDQVRAEKEKLFEQVSQIDRSRFSSNEKFAALLEEHGVEVPMKLSPTSEEPIPALARGDWAFKELLTDASQPPIVQAILAARVAAKSTLEETRSTQLLRLSQITWPTQGMGWAPVPLKYYGARPGRLSGDGGSNWQNIGRGSLIRSAIEAPEGYRVVHRDASQIEARMTSWLAGCESLLDAFAEGRDVYSEFASQIYQRKVTRDDIKERFVGKTAILGLGYGCGGARFRQMLYIGNGGISVSINSADAFNIVYRYRDTYEEIPILWDYMRFILNEIVSLKYRNNNHYRSEPLELPITPEENAIKLPNGMHIHYPDIRKQDGEIIYNDPQGGERRIYGAKATENISQALSRIIVTDIILRMRCQTGYHPFLMTHDSLDYCVPTSQAPELDEELERQFAIVPSWGAGLPLASEGGWGRTLAEAEKGVNQ